MTHIYAELDSHPPEDSCLNCRWCFRCGRTTHPDDSACPVCGGQAYTNPEADPQTEALAYAMGYGHNPCRYQGD